MRSEKRLSRALNGTLRPNPHEVACESWDELTQIVASLQSGRVRRVLEQERAPGYGLPATDILPAVEQLEYNVLAFRMALEQIIRRGL